MTFGKEKNERPIERGLAVGDLVFFFIYIFDI